jgi:hypothetical protein
MMSRMNAPGWLAKLPMAIDARLRPGGLVLERARIARLQVRG